MSNDIRSLAEYLRQQGGDEDTVLAHINPYEAEMLEDMGGSGEINPVTGLPQYGLFGKGGLGAVLGGLAGTFVGAPMLGAALGSQVKGGKKKRREDDEEGFLSKLGSKSSDFFSDPMNLLSVGSAAASALSRPKKERKLTPEEIGNEQLRMMLASQLEPEEFASREKRLSKARRMSPEELREFMQYKQSLERAEWEARNNLAPGEELNIDPVYRKDNDEEEFKKTGRWFEYYNDPEFKVKRVYMAEGGRVPNKNFAEVRIDIEPHNKHHSEMSGMIPSLLYKLMESIEHHDKEDDYSGYIDGEDGGQDDTIEARLSPGEYVIDAETVSYLGDGNSRNGAKKLDEFIRSVRNHKRSSYSDEIGNSILEIE